MVINKLWIVIGSIVILLLVSILVLNRTPEPNSDAGAKAAADSAHESFMVQGGKNDHPTGVKSKLGS